MRTVLSALLLTAAAVHSAAQECVDAPAAFEPVIVSYGPDTAPVVIAAQADGSLIAADDAGHLLWRFIPPELSADHTGENLMGAPRVLRFDANGDGTIDPLAGDKVWIYFGMHRGGSFYYALDASERDSASVLWKAGPEELPGVGETWSVPTLARVRTTDPAQSTEEWVILAGGGYHESHMETGNRVYMLDAASGRLLWYAGGAGTGSPDLVLPDMTHAVTARVVALDTDGDARADRLYTADLGGRIWRFDVWNGAGRADLVTGGVFAALGTADAPGSDPADARRFFNAPDVAFVPASEGGAYFSLAIGSGDPRLPLGTVVRDRFYVLRDRNSHTRLTAAEYRVLVPIVDAELFDVTEPGVDPPHGAPGWKIDLYRRAPGEKVLSEAFTANGTIFFITYRPPADAPGGCVSDGSIHVHARDLETARATLDLDEDGQVTDLDASMPLDTGGLRTDLRIVHRPRDPEATGDTSSPGTECIVAGVRLPDCVPVPRLRRTWWRRVGTE